MKLARALRISIALAAGVLLIAAGDSSAKGRAAKSSAHGGAKQVIVAIGDSITAGYPDYSPTPEIRAQQHAGDNPRSQWEYWAQRKHPELQIRNCGVPGDRTDEIAQRLGSCVQGANGVVIEGGLNDIGQDLTPEVAAANLLGMVRDVKSRGLGVAIADAPPWTRWHPWFDPKVDALNDQIHQIALQEDIPLLPFHETLEDPGQPGVVSAGWLSWDNSHPSVAGYRRLGERAFRVPVVSTQQASQHSQRKLHKVKAAR
jgi:lysophospholipase L1-like esterase